jgi:uncharacterized protein YndB with AHSA1/START domain
MSLGRYSTTPGCNGDPGYGRVEVRLTLDVPPAEAWHALTNTESVEHWLGVIRPALRTGGRATLDFGDGDSFAIRRIRLDPPRRVRYAWRFLGIGPLDSICWQISPAGRGCEVVVTDDEPGRSFQEAAELREGWLDFTGRLARFLATGERTRYDWRRDFDGAVELAITKSDAWRTLFAPARQARWLPLAGIALEDGAPLAAESGTILTPPRALAVHWEPPDSVSFQVAHPGWLQPTSCRIRLSPRGDRVRLSVSHVGWETISDVPDIPPRYRRRFAVLWIAALRRAGWLVGADPDAPH